MNSLVHQGFRCIACREQDDHWRSDNAMVARTTSESTVFVIDDEASIRRAFGRLITSVGLKFEQFSSAEEFLNSVRPDREGCVVLDLRMPGIGGLELQRNLQDRGIDLPIIFVTGYATVPVTVRAMKSGAQEVLTKPVEDQALLEAVYSAIESQRAIRAQRDSTAIVERRYNTLSSREQQVMRLVLKGLLNKQIAVQLGITEKTVKAHRSKVMQKMQVRNVIDLLRASDELGR